MYSDTMIITILIIWNCESLSLVFSRFMPTSYVLLLRVLISSLDRVPCVIGYSDYFGFGFTNSVEKRCTCNAVTVVCYIYDVWNSVFVLVTWAVKYVHYRSMLPSTMFFVSLFAWPKEVRRDHKHAQSHPFR